MATRSYTMGKRADAVDETRRRITEAAVELHGSLGPARTTISAIAEQAGVQRLTVYRHFPDDESLFRACTSHWAAEHPAPDAAAWTSIEDPVERLRVALDETYSHFRDGEEMLWKAARDVEEVSALAKVLSEGDGGPDPVEVLMHGWTVRGKRRKRLSAAIGHALDFLAWRSLKERGLHDDDIAELMTAFVERTAEPDNLRHPLGA